MKVLATVAIVGFFLLLLLTNIPTTILQWVLQGLDLVTSLTEKLLQFAIVAKQAGDVIVVSLHNIGTILRGVFG